MNMVVAPAAAKEVAATLTFRSTCANQRDAAVAAITTVATCTSFPPGAPVCDRKTEQATDFYTTTYSLHCSSFFGLTNSILRILKGNPKKELQWRLQVVISFQQYGNLNSELARCQASTLNPKFETLNPEPSTLDSEPSKLIPEPEGQDYESIIM